MLRTLEQLKQAGFEVLPRENGLVQVIHKSPFFYFRPQFETTVSRVVQYCLEHNPAGQTQLLFPMPSELMINEVLPFVFITTAEFTQLVQLESSASSFEAVIKSAQDGLARIRNHQKDAYIKLIGVQ